MKLCRRCGEQKTLEDFHRHWKAADGLQSYCKQCQADYQRIRAQVDPAKRREYNRRHHLKHREKHLARRESPEKRAARWKRYYAANSETLKPFYASHRNSRRGAKGALTSETQAFMTVLRGDPCCYCGKPMRDVDHIQPLDSGGEGGWENLTASCRSCNATKATSSLLSFLLRRRVSP